ncbi:hypothetical protein BpHYR1_019078 [Brachionus plicatilis]|uniref:Uncharacterized protein n=1 Tax=Brachionus plicatilis TaxID=10195 RepID=A0A3M7RYU1_BRAPC|nr:hypothetical protein BpHYR1_019078 [Brachionus plicatilis]
MKLKIVKCDLNDQFFVYYKESVRLEPELSHLPRPKLRQVQNIVNNYRCMSGSSNSISTVIDFIKENQYYDMLYIMIVLNLSDISLIRGLLAYSSPPGYACTNSPNRIFQCNNKA